jgi:HlyD family type I secretion membrane fusion protein
MIALVEQIRSAMAEERHQARKLWDVDAYPFLPAAMEIVERPVSPTLRWTVRLLLVGLAATVTWVTFGKVDVVASASGRLVPVDRVKLIQPAEAGVVRAILVRDGERVRAGQTLVELDPTVSGAERVQAEKALESAQLDTARARAMLAVLDGGPLLFRGPPGTTPEVTAIQTALARAQLDQIVAEGASARSNVETAVARRNEARIQAAKLEEALPLLDQQIAAQETLLAKGFVSKLKVIEMRRQRLAAARDRDAALESARRAEAEIFGARSSSLSVRAAARAKVLDLLTRASSETRLRSEELVKAVQRSRLQRLVAPVDGTIGQLSVHTVGGVVEPTRPIMVIVPAGGRLELEAKLLNRDAGFVRVGQAVAVKLEAYPFTRFGTVPGRVVSIGSDAIEDDRLGLLYPVRVSLEKSGLGDVRHKLALSSGMAATADVRTGQRTILSYLIDPITAAKSEAGRER